MFRKASLVALMSLTSMSILASTPTYAKKSIKHGHHSQAELARHNPHPELLVPAAAEVSHSYLDNTGLFGNWSTSPTMERLGLTPKITLTSDIQGNPGGGRSHGFRQFSNIFVGMGADLKKSLGMPDTKFFVSFSERFGTSLTQQNIGNNFNVAQVCCGATYRLVDLYLEQPLMHDQINIRAGRISAGDEFLSSPLYWYYVQNGIDGNPVGIFRNAPGMTAYPTATWGGRLRITPIKEFDVMAGVFNGDPTIGQNNKHGMDWTNRGPGFYLVELGYHPNRGDKDKLPGNYKLGGFYNNGSFTNFLYDSNGGIAPTTGLPFQTHSGNKGWYVLIDQMVYSQGDGRGITPFISYLVAPNAAYNLMPYFINGGVVYKGPFAARENDVAALGVVYGSFSNTARVASRISNPTAATQNFETVVELFYIYRVAKWLNVQPDFQYIIRPNGTGTIPNATVVGAQIGLTF